MIYLTWHTTGAVDQMRSDPLFVKLQQYMFRGKFSRLLICTLVRTPPPQKKQTNEAVSSKNY